MKKLEDNEGLDINKKRGRVVFVDQLMRILSFLLFQNCKWTFFKLRMSPEGWWVGVMCADLYTN